MCKEGVKEQSMYHDDRWWPRLQELQAQYDEQEAKILECVYKRGKLEVWSWSLLKYFAHSF